MMQGKELYLQLLCVESHLKVAQTGIHDTRNHKVIKKFSGRIRKLMQEIADYGDKELAKFKEGKNEK